MFISLHVYHRWESKKKSFRISQNLSRTYCVFHIYILWIKVMPVFSFQNKMTLHGFFEIT